MKNIWNTKEDSKQQRTTICIKIHREIYKSTGNYKTIINNILSSDKWTNRKD